MKVFIFGLIFLCVGIGCAYFGLKTVQNARASSDWPTVKGKIISSDVEQKRSTSGSGRKRKSSTTYHAEVYYEYAVNGVTQSSDRVSFGQYGSSNSGHAREIVNRYPAGSIVDVYYSEEKPEISVLEPGATWSSYMLLGFGCVFGLAGMLICLAGFSKRN